MIYSGLEFGQYFELERDTKCHNVLLALTPATRMAFIFIQMYFIFLNNEVSMTIACLPNFSIRKLLIYLLAAVVSTHFFQTATSLTSVPTHFIDFGRRLHLVVVCCSK